MESLKRSLEETSRKLQSVTRKLEAADPVEFCTSMLGFVPFEYQRKALLDQSKFLSLRWSRQSGKTATVCSLLLHHAVKSPSKSIGVVAPSLRQSKAVLGRIANLARKLPKEWTAEVQKTRIRFSNGSVIEAYPNNPDTIRGPSLDVVYCDEMGFIRDDKELYDAILFTLITRPHSRFIASSTPGSKDNLFYKFCTDPKYGFSNHHVNWKDAVEPNGPLKKDTLEMIKSQLAPDPWRWRREMEAEFAENEDSFFPLSLITDAVDQSLAYTEFTEYVAGKRLYAGVDFGKHHDHSAVGVVEHDLTTKMAKLIHMHKFPLETEYGSVIGYVKRLVGTWKEIRKITTDETGIGDVVTEDMRNEGLRQTVGIGLNIQTKTDIMENLRNMLTKKELKLPYDPDLIGEMNAEKFELNKTGQIQFSHPSGTHDDQLWALALACHGLREESRIPEYHPVVLTGYVIKPRIPYFTIGKQPWKRDPLYNQTARLCMACGARRPLTMPYCPKCGSGSDGPNPAFVKP